MLLVLNAASISAGIITTDMHNTAPLARRDPTRTPLTSPTMASNSKPHCAYSSTAPPTPTGASRVKYATMYVPTSAGSTSKLGAVRSSLSRSNSTGVHAMAIAANATGAYLRERPAGAVPVPDPCPYSEYSTHNR